MQEVFQAVTPNFYAPEGQPVVPLVMVGSRYWTETMPVWPLLRALAAGRAMAPAVHLVDSTDEALAALSAARPVAPPSASG